MQFFPFFFNKTLFLPLFLQDNGKICYICTLDRLTRITFLPKTDFADYEKNICNLNSFCSGFHCFLQ